MSSPILDYKRFIQRFRPHTLRSKMMVLAIVMVSLPTLVIGYLVETEGRDALLQEKKIKLSAVTRLLDDALKDSFKLYPDLPRDQRIAALNKQLAPVTDTITKAFSGVGAGYYNRELDAIITYGPQALHGNAVGVTIKQNHPGRDVMATGEPLVRWGSQVRGNIMNSMIPIKRDDQVIGYIWANELSNDIARQALAMDLKIIAVICIGMLFSIWMIVAFSRRFASDIDTIKSGLNELPLNLKTQIPPMKGEMGEISDSVNSLSRALREAKTLNELIIESAADGVISVDIEGCVTMMNPAAEEITGYRQKELIGRPYAEIFENTNFFSPVLDTLIHDIEHVALEVDYPGKNRTIQISVSTSQLRNAQGDTVGALVIFTDLTAKKEVQRRIEQAERLATLGELMAGVAHEVRNPLTAISGFVQILKDSETDPQRLEYTQIILKEVHSINKVIQQLLDFARPRPSLYQKINLNQIINQSLILVKTKGVEARIDFVVQLEESLSDIEADGELLKQVLLNLLINAVQSIAARGEIIITTRALSPDWQEITISDNGCGISDEIKTKIFDPFYTTKPSGTGLGLSISHRIITAHDGDITLTSKLNQGTTFTIVLPVKHSEGIPQ
ncbi:two-component system sensor histidine kinase AtoS [Budviciaceae bacterium CWB-B4]|uniref:histidine kinase n=1 Tax=Limnobaculum xujianqingii TaxID=2738837 RepID=A0A9D7FWF7_9GAMM|nr:two-component system sensor histidine kinase AtoS [Limnobaculum xujianqingii]MBK5075020.1 two-component system sensor histidine kinase AtoS [Limnobaculum xujianqingii]MBK5178337.1 two-component system sensor histidine kinase AtoS [Limnobaculum xujianqingii]